MIKVYVGIDPGFTGAIGWIDEDGEHVGVEDLPVIKIKKLRQFDLHGLNGMIYKMSRKELAAVGLENPTTRPGEGAERCKRFGEGIGMLKALLTAHQIGYECVSPNLWTGRLGIPGKSDDGGKEHNRAGAQLLVTHYPVVEKMVYGPRGGVKDGRLDALLIAHWMRINDAKLSRALSNRLLRRIADAGSTRRFEGVDDHDIEGST